MYLISWIIQNLLQLVQFIIVLVMLVIGFEMKIELMWCKINVIEVLGSECSRRNHAWIRKGHPNKAVRENA